MRMALHLATITPTPTPKEVFMDTRYSTPRRRTATVFACTLAAALAVPLAHSRPLSEQINSASIEELKALYLACDRASTAEALTRADVKMCSTIYEALKHRAFDGDFDKLLAWSRANPSPRRGER